MEILTFRIMVDDQEKFIREVEIKASQTFKMLHDFIVSNLKLDANELASFHISDDQWNKLLEISLIDMTGAARKKKPSDEKLPKLHLMDKTRVGTYYHTIGQKLIYEYDFLQMHTFLIELIEIETGNEEQSYPHLSFSNGKLDLRSRLKVEQDSEKLKQELLAEFQLMMKNEDEDDEDDFGSNEDDF
jgi:hypothetical protein